MRHFFVCAHKKTSAHKKKQSFGLQVRLTRPRVANHSTVAEYTQSYTKGGFWRHFGTLIGHGEPVYAVFDTSSFLYTNAASVASTT